MNDDANLRDGDRVEYVGPSGGEPDDPQPGERGWLLTPGGLDGTLWVVTFDRAGTSVFDKRWVRKVGDRNEPDPAKRLPEDPFGPKGDVS
jgi:hypothetical protein